MEKNISAIIMAAGNGTGMKSSLPVAMQKICGHPIIEFVINKVSEVATCTPIVVLGKRGESIKEHLGDNVEYAYQDEPLGTGHAVMAAKDYLKDNNGYVLVLAGNIPLITSDTLKSLVDYCKKGDYDAVALTALSDKPQGYGRIIRNILGDFEGIIEDQDASEEERLIKEINTSIYCFSVPALLEGLEKLDKDNARGRYYLTDVLGISKRAGKKVGLYTTYDATQVFGINTRAQQVEAQRTMGQRINNYHLDKGVNIIDPQNTYIGPYVKLGRDVTIYPGNVLEGNTVIGEGTILYPNNRILDSALGREVQIQISVILESQIGDRTNIGPFAYLRPGSHIEDDVRIGDFVEIKNAKVGKGSKVSHLAYVGDGEIGENVNIGCGVIFVNYDGKKKHRTIIGDNAFVGCNTNLVAPVEVKNNSYIAAGSTITEDVPEHALAIARARQINKENWTKEKEQETEEDQ